MRLPGHLQEKLGYDILHQKLQDLCATELGRHQARQSKFSSNYEVVQLWLSQVAEFMQIIAEGNVPPLGNIVDIADFLERARIQGNWLPADELYKILVSLSASRELSNFIFEKTTDDTSLGSYRRSFAELKPLELRLTKSVDEEGRLLDSASAELKAIRRKVRAEEGVLRKKVETIYRQAKASGMVPEGATISVRDGRLVIPVHAANKRQIQGFVHDESANGRIVFLEPALVLEANNLLRELQIAESREIQNILFELTSVIAENYEALLAINQYLGELDFLWARAKLARQLDASKPKLSKQKANLKALRHPLLVLVAHTDQRQVISHALDFDDTHRIIIISGPNAGGKSVAMKSVGLNQLMLQSGLLPCADTDSTFRIFDKIFVDIGDEQSIDNDLSTYSSHLRNMVLMIRKAGPDSLVLIDEFGSGTDPVFGGAIAEAVLAQLSQQGVFGIITTHFGNLKLFADHTPGLVNAAMLFDLKKLKPLYELEVGRPGSSFSLEVAGKSGLPPAVLKQAEDGVGVNQLEIENLLTRLEDEKRRFERQNKQIAEKDRQLSKLKEEYEALKKKLEAKQKDIINLAKQEASQILSRTNKEIEKTIRHIKENKAEKKETKRVRESLQKFAGKVRPEKSGQKPVDVEVVEGILKPGDQALLEDKNVVVTVQEIKGKKAKVLIGELQSVVSLQALIKVSNKEVKKLKKSSGQGSANSTVNELLAAYTPVLDVRGTRATDLLNMLQKFIDESVMLGQQSVKVIHGKGNGVLRDLVRNELKQWPQVERYENEHVERGGDGATLIYFK